MPRRPRYITRAIGRIRRFSFFLATAGALAARAAVFHVSPAGDDRAEGSSSRPFASPARAQSAARTVAGREEVRVRIHPGTYYLPTPLVFTPEDSGTAAAPVKFESLEGGPVVFSGGTRLFLNWQAFRDGILKARTPDGLKMDQLFIDGRRQPMARYPNFDPAVPHFNGFAPDCISPARTARWNDPTGAYIHAMHEALWGDMHWIIRGKRPDGGLDYEGGWQNNRPSRMHPQYRFVENLFEELDAPGEWFHDAKSRVLYYQPEAGVTPATAVVEVVRLPHLIEVRGTREKPVHHLTFSGITFRHTTRSFMENREPLLRSDWTVYRGGAVFLTGAEDCRIERCTFDQVGGNAVFVNHYNRRLHVGECLIRDAGANGISFVGDPAAVRSPLFNYNQKFDYAALDRTPGPKTPDFPADCTVEDCLITRIGRVEKQTAGVQISMSQGITVRHCTIHDVPRAGINVSEGTWGGHLIEDCDIFNTVLETGDHGSWNSWGRDRYWHPSIHEVDRQVAQDPSLPRLDAIRPVVLRHNRWRCDHGWDVDLDDGSSNYVIHDNLFLNGGLKMREGYGRIATNNIIVNNSLHAHCWYAGSGDVFRHNIVFTHYQPAGGMPVDKWGAEVDYNLFTSSEADRTRFAAQGCDAHSIVADPQFVDPSSGDFRVKPGSTALQLGFRNFAMDTFGVRTASLKALAGKPAIPRVEIRPDLRPATKAAAVELGWRGAAVRDLGPQEFSAFGVTRESGGVAFARLPANARAARDGFEASDLIQSVNGQPVRTVAELAAALLSAGGKPVVIGIIRAQSRQEVTLKGGVEPPRI